MVVDYVFKHLVMNNMFTVYIASILYLEHWWLKLVCLAYPIKQLVSSQTICHIFVLPSLCSFTVSFSFSLLSCLIMVVSICRGAWLLTGKELSTGCPFDLSVV